MKKLTFLPTIDKSFQSKVEDLASEGAQIIKSHAALTQQMLAFAGRFKQLGDRAKVLDKGEHGVHAEYLWQTMEVAVQSANQSIWSRWNTIGTYHKELKQFAKYLPPQRDGLYEIALAAKEGKPIQRWIEGEKVSVHSSVRDLRALRKPKFKKRRSGKRSHLNAQVTLCFSTYGEAVSTLADIVKSNGAIEVRSSRAFVEALREKVEPDEFEEIKDRIRQV